MRDNHATVMYDATVWTHGVGMGTVHPVIEERLHGLALRLGLV